MEGLSTEDLAKIAAFRTHLQTCEAKGWERFDDAVFKLSAGGLALSVTFLGVTSLVRPSSMPWVYGAWIAWSTSLLLMLCSIYTGQSGLRSQIAHLDTGTYYQVKMPEGVLGRLTPGLNIAAIATTSLGLIFLLIFAFMNISGRSSVMANKDGASLITGTRGQVTPIAPTVTMPRQPSDGAGQVAPQAPPVNVVPPPVVVPKP